MKFFLLSVVAILSLTACPANQSKSKPVASEESEEASLALQKPAIDGVTLRLSDEAMAIVLRKQGKAAGWYSRLRADEKEATAKMIEDWKISLTRVSRDKDGTVKLSAFVPYDFVTRDPGFRSATLSEAKKGVWAGEIEKHDVVVTCLPAGTGVCDPSDNAVIEIKTRGTQSNHRPRLLSLLMTSTSVSATVEGQLSLASFTQTAGLLTSQVWLTPGSKTQTYLKLTLLSLTKGQLDLASVESMLTIEGLSQEGQPQNMSWGVKQYRSEIPLKETPLVDGGSITLKTGGEKPGLIRISVPRGLIYAH